MSSIVSIEFHLENLDYTYSHLLKPDYMHAETLLYRNFQL